MRRRELLSRLGVGDDYGIAFYLVGFEVLGTQLQFDLHQIWLAAESSARLV